VQNYPGRGHPDVHLEGRAADIYLNFDNPEQRAAGEWLFEFLVHNCRHYGIQGVIYGDRRWFSEQRGGVIQTNPPGGGHRDHVHVELNLDGANLFVDTNGDGRPDACR
jgi:hypothetical protein